MKKVQLVHNPGSGDESHSKESLIAAIEAGGFECRYSSTKDGDSWKTIEDDTDIIAVAGGDGTVRKVLKRLLKEKREKKPVIGVLALGTANNVAKTFNLRRPVKEVVAGWKEENIKKVDIGMVKNIPDVKFFFEGLGFGIFPYLMKEMKKVEEDFATPEDELKGALKKLHSILGEYKARQCTLTVDGTDHSGKFYMVEVMNIRSIGPNMLLAPQADPGDGEFEIVLVPESHKEKCADFILKDLIGEENSSGFHTLKGKEISIEWDGARVHADDEMLKLPKRSPIEIKMKPGVFEFFALKEESANG